MTPLETELLQRLGTSYLHEVEALSIFVFFYGASSSLVVHGLSTSLIKRSLCCTFLCLDPYFRVRFPLPVTRLFLDPPRFHRRRGFSTRATTVMFIVTAINFLLSSLSTGYQISGFIVFIRKALILDIEYPLSEKPESVNSALQNFNMVDFRSGPVSNNLLRLVSVSNQVHVWWRYYSAISLSFGGLGRSSQIDGR